MMICVCICVCESMCVCMCVLEFTLKNNIPRFFQAIIHIFSTLFFFYVLLTIRHNGFLWFMLQHRNKKRSKKNSKHNFCVFLSFFHILFRVWDHLLNICICFGGIFFLFRWFSSFFHWLWRESSARVFKQAKKKRQWHKKEQILNKFLWMKRFIWDFFFSFISFIFLLFMLLLYVQLI